MASYPPPNPQQGAIFNPIDWIEPNAGSIDTAYLNEHYCQFPVAQGSMSFAGINNTGTTTIKQNLVMTGTSNVNYVEFPDGTKQYSASASTDILNDANTWSGENTFNPLPIQPYGATMMQGITLTNNQQSNNAGGNDIVSYSPNSTVGLSIFSLGEYSNTAGKSPQIQLYPDGVETLIQALGANGKVLVNASSGGGVIELLANANVLLTNAKLTWGIYGSLIGSSAGIESNVNLTSTSFIISDTVNDNYQLFSQNSPNYGMVIANTSGNLGKITLSNGSTTLSTLTATTTGLNISTAITLPAQTTYTPSTTYGDVGATQQFVQLALASQGSGDVTLAGNNAFTGSNTFSGGCASLIVQPFPSPSSTQFTTLNYVNNLQPIASTLTFFVGIGFGGTSQYFTIPTLIIASKIVQIFNYTINVANVSQTSSNIIGFSILDSDLSGQENLIVSVFIASTLQTYTCPITYWNYSGGNISVQATCPINLYGLGSIAITFNGYLTL